MTLIKLFKDALTKIKKDRTKDPDEQNKVWTAESIWGPLGHFNVYQKDITGDVWSIVGVLTGESDLRMYSDIKTTREQAVEHAKVLAGIAPFRPEEIRMVPVTDRRGLVEHSRSQT